MAKAISDGDKTDFDETRRLLYMALCAPDTKRYNLAGTLINALRHHHGVEDEDLESKVIDLVNSGDSIAARGVWARKQIARITAELDDS